MTTNLANAYNEYDSAVIVSQDNDTIVVDDLEKRALGNGWMTIAISQHSLSGIREDWL